MEARYEGIAEYVSRPARMRLVEHCISVIDRRLKAEREQRAKRGIKGRPIVAASVLADMLNVTWTTVKRWRKDVFQARNINAKLLLATALSLDEEGARKILIEDLARHRRELYNIIKLEDEGGET